MSVWFQYKPTIKYGCMFKRSLFKIKYIFAALGNATSCKRPEVCHGSPAAQLHAISKISGYCNDHLKYDHLENP